MRMIRLEYQVIRALSVDDSDTELYYFVRRVYSIFCVPVWIEYYLKADYRIGGLWTDKSSATLFDTKGKAEAHMEYMVSLRKKRESNGKLKGVVKEEVL
jgi:hypothetical protein